MAARTRTTPPTQLDELRQHLGQLKLYAMLDALDDALEQAQTLQQGYAAFLGALVSKQVLAVTDAAAERRISAAKFPKTRTFDGFDWTFQPGLNVQLVKDLMNLHFVRQARPVVLLGKPGTGKSHISIAYGHLAALSGYNVRFYEAKKLLDALYASLADSTTDRFIARLARSHLLIIDDIRQIPAKPEHASLLYDVIDARHGRVSTIVSSNLNIKQWGKALGNATLTASLVDRLMERAHIINIRRGRSYRVHGPDAPPANDRPAELDDTDGSE